MFVSFMVYYFYKSNEFLMKVGAYDKNIIMPLLALCFKSGGFNRFSMWVSKEEIFVTIKICLFIWTTPVISLYIRIN